MICYFISRFLSSRIINCYISGNICKIAIFETQIATFLVILEKSLLFETQIATYVGISKKLLLFYWKCYISWEIYKFAIFSINCVKLKLFNQFLQLLCRDPRRPMYPVFHVWFIGSYKSPLFDASFLYILLSFKGCNHA